MRNTALRRWLVPLLAAAAVLAVVVVAWTQRPGASDDVGVAGSAGSGGAGEPSYDGSGAPGVEPSRPGVEPLPSAGGTAGSPGSPGSPPMKPGGKHDRSVAPARDQQPGTLPVVGYHVRPGGDGRRLVLSYTNGVPECYGTAGMPQVLETARAVTVTLPRVPPPETSSPVACIEIAVIGTVDLTLDAPLGDRVVRDAGRGGAVVPADPDAGTTKPVH